VLASFFGTTAVVVIDLAALFPKEPAYPAGFAKSGFAPFSTVMGKGVFFAILQRCCARHGVIAGGVIG
jgi:predicted small integral membrane protein